MTDIPADLLVKAREITACPKVPDSASAERICPFGWNACRRAAECEMVDEIASALHEIAQAARIEGFEAGAASREDEVGEAGRVGERRGAEAMREDAARAVRQCPVSLDYGVDADPRGVSNNTKAAVVKAIRALALPAKE